MLMKRGIRLEDEKEVTQKLEARKRNFRTEHRKL